eukprot:TRINITY_DN7437_c0_g1_i2.p1 TRINITY_DN7437_c0_g1~~TRINITY_DN7437_c0_g1_i2.p1  ORF type:complete len:228 (+),score=50.43 TRINITY_DN7437_c0_g1_i2:59-742(+)
MFGGDEVGAAVLDTGCVWTKGGYAGDDAPKQLIPSHVGVLYSTGSDNTVGAGPKAIGDEPTAMDIDRPKQRIQYYAGTGALSCRRDNMELKNPFEKGLISDWEVAEQLWNHSFSALRIDPSTTPVLLAEPNFNTKANREKMAEIFFEKYQTPATFISKNAVLSSFASGKPSALVVDCGGGITTVTPVHDGYALQKCMFKSPVSGNLLTDEYYKILEQRNIQIRPRKR